ncbi:C2H2 finger domain protein, putative [Cordyceps militaris CM01]|uniref:C2H2 finger domain protein, putative n=1 Tax=Cordyceps militaris (strain CM01) TaxID=983644 RepID=G3JR75_CORMM|nr:C2H2 finger domain protein, putative [Cordyceps militaris CM01]EGX88371.1 C2H2 finger domain protein, putative [Cordyceps militaris CM01]
MEASRPSPTYAAVHDFRPLPPAHDNVMLHLRAPVLAAHGLDNLVAPTRTIPSPLGIAIFSSTYPRLTLVGEAGAMNHWAIPIHMANRPSPQQYYAQSPQSRYSADSTTRSQGASSPNDRSHESVDHKTPETGYDFYMSDGDQSNSTGMPSSVTGSTYSSPSDSSNERNKHAKSSSTDWNLAGEQFSVSPRLQLKPEGLTASSFGFDFSASSTGFDLLKHSMDSALPMSGYEEASMKTGKSLFTSPAIRTLPMPFGGGRSTDVLMAVQPAIFQDRMMEPRLSMSPTGMTFVDHFAIQSMPVLALSQSVREAVPVYLEVYWNKVHPMYPIIHRSIFEKAIENASEAIDILQCAMAAVATQFLGHEDHRSNGSQLHFHAVCKLKVASNTDSWPIETMQAILLSEYYMRFRGRDKDAFQASDLFRSLYEKANHKVTMLSKASLFGRPETWEAWVEDEAHRRLLASCFLLDVHCMRYFERPSVSVTGLDYSSPSRLVIPLSANTTKLWDAATPESWSKLNPQCPRLNVGLAITQGYKPLDMQKSSPFDASVLLAAYSLQFPSQRSSTRLDLIQDLSGVDMSNNNVLNLFTHSAVANTYLALHFTPLHIALSVSGDSWVFNSKILRLSAFAEHQDQLSRWRDSGSSAAAAAFAARALVAFLGLGSDDTGTAAAIASSCTEISDFWGIYVCALICWAFGHVGRDGSGAWNDGSSRPAALQWLQSAAKMQPVQVQRLAGRRNAQAVVGLAREALEHEQFGGRTLSLHLTASTILLFNNQAFTMQTSSILVSLLASGLASAARNSYITPVDFATMSVEQYGSPYISSTHTTPNTKFMEHTSSTSHFTKVTGTWPQYTSKHTASVHNTAPSYKPTMSAAFDTPTYGPVQSVASHLDARGIFIATVVAGLVYLM